MDESQRSARYYLKTELKSIAIKSNDIHKYFDHSQDSFSAIAIKSSDIH